MKVSEMSDAELVRAVAEEVMERNVVEGSNPTMFMDGRGPVAVYYTIELTSFNQFSPLTNANNRDTVVEKMVKSHHDFAMQAWQTTDGIIYEVRFTPVIPFTLNMNLGRAVCEAALAAVRGENAL